MGLTREDVIGLLERVYAVVDAGTERVDSRSAEATVILQSDASSALRDMIEAMRGLDTGAVDPLFQPRPPARKSLAAREARVRSEAIDLYDAIRKVRPTIPATELERRIARTVGVTAKDLHGWRQNHRRRKRIPQRPL
jgi:hypothetical protein